MALTPVRRKTSSGKFRRLARAAGHNDTVVDDVGGEFWRSFLQDVFDGFYHIAEFAGDGFDDFIRLDFGRARKAGNKVAAFDDDGELFFERHRGTDLDFDIFGRFVADSEVESFLYVIGDGVIDFISGAFDRCRSHDAAERNHRHVCRASADIDDHMSASLVNRNAGADCRENRLFHHISVFGSGTEWRLR